MKFGKVTNHTITITPTANFGFVVNVGCGTFAFENDSSLLTALGEFLVNPEKAEKEYNSINPSPAADQHQPQPRSRPGTAFGAVAIA
jgi:hypothetical protein